MRLLLIGFILILCCGFAQAQFQFDIGLSAALSNTKEQTFMNPYTPIGGGGIKDTNFYRYQISSKAYGVMVYPKYHLGEVKGMTVSLGAPLMFGLSGSSNPQYGSNLSLMSNLAFAIDLHGGRLNRRQDYPEKMLGYFIGAGVGMISTTGVLYEGGKDNAVTVKTKGIKFVPENEYPADYINTKSRGLLFHGGFCLPLTFKKQDEKSLGVRFFVQPGLGENHLTYYGLSLFIAFSNNRGY